MQQTRWTVAVAQTLFQPILLSFFFKEPAKKKIVRLNFGHSYEMICLTKGAELCMKSRFDTPQSARKQAPSQQRKTPGYALDMLSTQRTTNVDFAF